MSCKTNYCQYCQSVMQKHETKNEHVVEPNQNWPISSVLVQKKINVQYPALTTARLQRYFNSI